MRYTKRITYTSEEVERLRRMGFVMEGVVVDEELVSIDGMQFTIVDEGQPMDQLKRAESWIRTQRDVVGAVQVAKVED